MGRVLKLGHSGVQAGLVTQSVSKTFVLSLPCGEDWSPGQRWPPVCVRRMPLGMGTHRWSWQRGSHQAFHSPHLNALDLA